MPCTPATLTPSPLLSPPQLPTNLSLTFMFVHFVCDPPRLARAISASMGLELSVGA